MVEVNEMNLCAVVSEVNLMGSNPRPKISFLDWPFTNAHEGPISAHPHLTLGNTRVGWVTQCVMPKQTCLWPNGFRRQVLHFATFKNSMVDGILQFTPSIAFRYVLHQCESWDIRCQESFCLLERKHRKHLETGHGCCILVQVPWRVLRRVCCSTTEWVCHPKGNMSIPDEGNVGRY